MIKRLVGWVLLASVSIIPIAAFAQVQVNQNFVTQGPAPAFGPTGVSRSADAPPNGTVTGAIGPVIADPLNANRLFIGTVGGGIWTTTNGGLTWTPLTDNQATLSISSLAFDPTDPNRNTLIAGTGLTSNGTVCSTGSCFFTGSGGLRNGLLYSTNGGSTWTSLGAATLGGQTVDAVAARGNVLLAGTFEESFAASAAQRRVGGLYRSANGGTSFTLVSGTGGLPTGPVTSIVGDPNNSNRIYAAVSSPTAATNAQTALFVSNDAGVNWTPVFGAAQSGGSISAANQTVLKVASAPGGALAVGVVNLSTGTVTGLFWSGNSGANWTTLSVPALNNGAQAPINFAIAINPTNTNLVYVSGDRTTAVPFTVTAFQIDAVNSPGTATSITDANTSNGSSVHADSRALTFDANGRLILTSDGGIYARTNPGSNTGAWTSLNGNVSVLQPYAVGYDAVGKRLIAAAQDNGVAIQSSRNNLLWNTVHGADGINAFVNDVTLAGAGQTAFYKNSQNLSFTSRIVLDAQGNQISPNTVDPNSGLGANVTCNGGFVCETQVAGASTIFKAPWVNNRVDPTRMAMAGFDVYVTQDTLTGAQGPTAASVDLKLTDVGTTASFVTTIAYGTRDNPNMLVAGAGNGIWQSTTATAGSLVAVPTYTAAGGLAPTGIVLDPRSQLRYFVADNTNLFGTTNQGTTFTNLTGNLPTGFIQPTSLEFISNNGVNALLVGGLNNVANAQSPIAAADSDAIGNLTNWRAFGTGLPNTQVSALSYNSAVDVLAVGTFGRGVFTLYDVTSYFPQATVLQFGLANNDSVPDASFLTNGIVGNRPLIKYGTGTLTIAGDATYTGGTTINGGLVVLGTGGTSGSILGNVAFCSNPADPSCDPSTNKALAFNRSDTYTFGGSITGAGQVFQIGSGTTVLTGTNTYTGATTVNAGTLEVDGSILNSSSVNVNFGGTLSGTGTVGSPTITIGPGGTLTPGNAANPTGTLTIIGNLAFQSGALYVVQVNSAAASSTQVTGTASLAGTVLAFFAPGSFMRSYDILHAAGGLGGTTFSGLTTNVPANFTASLGYSATDVLLSLTANLGTSGGCLTVNQCNVANAINTFFNNGGALPPNFLTLFNLTGANLANALTLLSGELATGAQQPAFQLMNEFMGLMLDPFVDGRAGVGGAYGYPLSFAPDREALPEDIALAYSKVLRTPVYKATPFEQRWSVWGAGYGGYNKTSGDPLFIGSHDLTAQTAGGAAGLDYRIAPGTVVGFALAGAGTGWSLAQGLGSGRSDAFQAGVYGTTRYGPAYLAAALAYTEHWMSTDRYAFAGDYLTANFNAQSFGGRAEAGYRVPVALWALTPYAAVQIQNFHTPTYSETDVSGGGFGLTYDSRNATDTRSELGARFDRQMLLNWSAVLALRGRVAWAHDWVTNPSLVPGFEALPGASFIVNGATPAKNSALTSAGAELRLINGFSVLAKFDGEFASHSQTYAGTGTVRFTW